MSRWFRFHHEALNDPKVQRLDGDIRDTIYWGSNAPTRQTGYTFFGKTTTLQ